MFILVYGTISSNNSTLQISNFHPFLFDAINKTEYVIFYGLVDIEESKYIYIYCTVNCSNNDEYCRLK